MSFLQNGDAKMTEEICANALAERPDDANFLCLSGRALLMLGRFDTAEERLNNAIEIYPEFPRPHVVLGEMHLKQGLLERATQDLQRAVDLGDPDPNTQAKLGKVLMLLGDRGAARQAVEESMRLDPARRQLAEAFELEQTGKGEEAEKIYRDILAADPENVDALRLLAWIASSQEQHADAEILLKRALELAPDFGRALADLVVNQVEQEKTVEALTYANRMVRIAADNPDSYLLLGNARSAAGDYAGAIDAYKESLKLAPENIGALSGLAHNLKTLGHQDDAIATYRICIRINPFFTQTYWSLANLKTFRFTDNELSSIEQLLNHPDIPVNSQVHIYNTLGLAYEERDDFDRAFDSFRKCNEIKRTEEYYDPMATEDLHDRTIEVFDRDFVNQKSKTRKLGVRPIFIVGLPRSGSTLLEQILASHSLVEGTHELSDLGRIIQKIPGNLKVQGRFPGILTNVDASGFDQLGQEYLERTRKYRSGLRYFTDKNPNNFAQVGLVHLILPEAVIINARRHPLDSCLGSYKQLFAKGQPFSYDLTDLAEYYVQYDRLMDHWNEVLPGKVLDVRYEDVVDDLDTQVRRILDHCELPFEEQCLRFHETDRAVQTASSEQVRRPIYSSSVNLWRNYEQHLQPTIDILTPILRDLPGADRPDSFKS